MVHVGQPGHYNCNAATVNALAVWYENCRNPPGSDEDQRPREKQGKYKENFFYEPRNASQTMQQETRFRRTLQRGTIASEKPVANKVTVSMTYEKSCRCDTRKRGYDSTFKNGRDKIPLGPSDNVNARIDKCSGCNIAESSNHVGCPAGNLRLVENELGCDSQSVLGISLIQMLGQ